MKYLLVQILSISILLLTGCANNKNKANNTPSPSENNLIEEVKTTSPEKPATTPPPAAITNSDTESIDISKKEIVGIMAIGNEPGWGAKFNDTNFSLSLDYGDRNFSDLEYTVTSVSNKEWQVNASSGDIKFVITITRGSCRDDMSDQEFTHTVTIVLNENGQEQTYNGCGRKIG